MPTSALANPLVLPILGLLAEGPRHAYGIFTELRSRYSYAGVRNGTVYTLLRTLADAGLLGTRSTASDRQEFALTPAGERALAARVEREVAHGDLADRTAFLVALAYLGILAPEVAATALGERIARIDHEDDGLGDTLAAASALPELHMIETHFYRDQLSHERAWLESTAGRIRSGALPWPGRGNTPRQS
jgi:DNA-binding PadR family transcriptional regulator